MAIGLIAVTLLILKQLDSSYSSYNNQLKTLQMAHSIDNVAMISQSPTQMQHYIRSLQQNDRVESILLISKHDSKILLASEPRLIGKPLDELAGDIADHVRQSLATGTFLPNKELKNDRAVSILPLTSALGILHGNFALDQSITRQPLWHGLVNVEVRSLFERLTMTPLAVTNRFTAAPHTYSGAIVIIRDDNWLSGLTRSLFIETAILIALCFLCLVLAGWMLCRKYVIGPVATLSDVLKRQHNGEDDVRAPCFQVAEFSILGRQWNGLLDYRQTAEKYHQIFSTILQHVPVGICVTDRDARIEYANPAYRELYGRSLVELLGRTPAEVIHDPEMDGSVLAGAGKAMQDGKTWRGEITSRRADGKRVICDSMLCPVSSKDGTLERIIFVRQDITERKQYENDLLVAKLKSESADRAKTEFISKMSHELRTPFNSIIGFSNMIKSQQLGPVGNPSYIEFASLIEDSANSLLATINALIELSRIDARDTAVDETVLEPVVPVRRAIRALTKDDAFSDISIEVDDQLDGVCLRCDERMMQSLAEHILGNALKFNKPAGSVEIKLHLDSRNRVVIEFSDTGIGIEKDDLPHITEPFYQAASGAGRSHNGMGVGLTLARHLSLVHDARISFNSTPDKGTLVKVVFPARRTVAADSTPLQAATNNEAA